MSYRFLSIAGILAAFTVISCNKDDGGKGEDTPTAPTTITVSPESISAPRTAGDYSLAVTAPQKPKVSSKPDWVTVQDGVYNSQTYKVTLTVKLAANATYETRSGEIVLSAGTLTKSISVSQEGRPVPEIVDTNIATSLVTDGATEEASALYNYLLSNYGTKMLSSVMADVAWNHDIADKVNQRVGKYPAVNCYDFIHIAVPDGNGWIDYSNITPVTSWYNAGGIVSLMWHFNVPLSETTTIGKDGSGQDCNPSKTTFKASNALKSGTWENTFFYAQLDRVANVILKLQEQGIAAIWRPYHEAAGNYYALNYAGGAWFWWGAEGPEVFKQIWNATYDYFSTKGIKNLIWVWTAQNFNGDMDAYDNDEAYYPGDSRVDVVARDLYGSTAQSCGVEFVQLQNMYPHKMIALGECGWNGNASKPIASISQQWAQSAKWGWFMVWYANSYTMVDDAWWGDAFAQDYVITRDKVDY